jgi:hypothetical protein
MKVAMGNSRKLIYIYIYINGSYRENHLSMGAGGQSPVNTAF